MNVRSDFPIFRQHQKAFTYFDSAATSQKPYEVIKAVDNFYMTTNANVHRSSYSIAEAATYIYEKTREKAAHFINAKPEEISFTKNTNEAINQVATLPFVNEGDIIAVSAMEHHANIVPWLRLAKQKHARVEIIPMLPNYTLDYERFLKYHDGELEKIKVVAITYVSNVLGTINPIAKIIEQYRKVCPNAYFVVDAAQAVPHFPVDVQFLNCDALAFSGHKMLAPSGTGVLYLKPSLAQFLEPLNVGSSMISEVGYTDYSLAEIPSRFEVGTPNLEGIAGLGAAIDYLERIGMSKVLEHEQHISEYMRKKLLQIPGITLYRNPNPTNTIGVFSFNLDGIHAHDVAHILGEAGVCVRAGHHCAMPLMQTLGVDAVVRASLYLYNTEPEIDRFAFFLGKVRSVMKV